MRMKNLLILAMLIFVTGCAPTLKTFVNGQAYPTMQVKTVEEVEKRIVEEKNAKRGAIAIAYMNTSYLPGGNTIKNTSVKGNEIVAKLTFNQKVEMIKRRNGVYEKGWFRDVYVAVLKDNPLVYETCKTFWADGNFTPKEANNIVYSTDVNNYSLLTEYTMIGIKYTDKTKELPLEDVCSVKSAEFYLAEIAKASAARTEEYINK